MSRGLIFVVAICACFAFSLSGHGPVRRWGRGFWRRWRLRRRSTWRRRASRRRESGPSQGAQKFKRPTPQVVLTPHGGEFLELKALRYEIVYMPLQTRIYIFDIQDHPLSARDAHVEMSLNAAVRTGQSRQIPFRYIVMPPGATEQDYVVAVCDNRRNCTDPETPITFKFSGLDDRKHPTAEFTPIFKPEKIRPYVAKVETNGGRPRRGFAAAGLSCLRRDARRKGTARQALHRRLSALRIERRLHRSGQAVAREIPAASGRNGIRAVALRHASGPPRLGGSRYR